MIRLIMIRHGQTAWNAQKRYQGQSDIPLDDTGRAQAESLAQEFAGLEVGAVYSSDLQRAVQTAGAIAKAGGWPVTTDRRLRECSFGQWEGMTYREIQQRWPAEYAAWQKDPVTGVPPGGEALDQVLERVGAFVDDMREKLDGQTVMVVAHGGSIRALICQALSLPSHAFWRMSLGSGSVSELRVYSDTAVLTLFNDQHQVGHIAASNWVGRADSGNDAP